MLSHATPGLPASVKTKGHIKHVTRSGGAQPSKWLVTCVFHVSASSSWSVHPSTRKKQGYEYDGFEFEDGTWSASPSSPSNPYTFWKSVRDAMLEEPHPDDDDVSVNPGTDRGVAEELMMLDSATTLYGYGALAGVESTVAPHKLKSVGVCDCDCDCGLLEGQ